MLYVPPSGEIVGVAGAEANDCRIFENISEKIIRKIIIFLVFLFILLVIINMMLLYDLRCVSSLRDRFILAIFNFYTIKKRSNLCFTFSKKMGFIVLYYNLNFNTNYLSVA